MIKIYHKPTITEDDTVLNEWMNEWMNKCWDETDNTAFQTQDANRFTLAV